MVKRERLHERSFDECVSFAERRGVTGMYAGHFPSLAQGASPAFYTDPVTIPKRNDRRYDANWRQRLEMERIAAKGGEG